MEQSRSQVQLTIAHLPSPLPIIAPIRIQPHKAHRILRLPFHACHNFLITRFIVFLSLSGYLGECVVCSVRGEEGCKPGGVVDLLGVGDEGVDELVCEAKSEDAYDQEWRV